MFFDILRKREDGQIPVEGDTRQLHCVVILKRLTSKIGLLPQKGPGLGYCINFNVVGSNEQYF